MDKARVMPEGTKFQSYDFDAGFNGKMAKYRWEKVQRYLPPIHHGENLTALDVGAGTGIMARKMLGYFHNVVCLEPDSRRFEELEGLGVKAEHISFENYKAKKDQKFEAIFMFGVLEHVENPVSCLIKAGGYLAPSGRIFITVPNAESLHRRWGLARGDIKTIDELSGLDIFVGHERYYTAKSLIGDILAAGLFYDEITSFMLKPYPNNEMDKLPEELIDDLFRYYDSVLGGAELLAVCSRRDEYEILNNCSTSNGELHSVGVCEESGA